MISLTTDAMKANRFSGFAHDSTTREASVAKIPGFRNTPSFEKNPVRNETKGSAKKWSKGPGLNTSLKQNRAFSKWGWKVGNYNGAIMSGCWHDTKNNLLGLMPSIKIQFLDSWRTSPPSPSWLFVQRARFGSNTMAEFPINTSMQFEPKKLRFEMHRNLIGSAEKKIFLSRAARNSRHVLTKWLQEITELRFEA